MSDTYAELRAALASERPISTAYQRRFNHAAHPAIIARLLSERDHLAELADSEGTRAVNHLRRARKAEAERDALASSVAAVEDVLHAMLHCRYPVSTEIRSDGFDWDVARLNEVMLDYARIADTAQPSDEQINEAAFQHGLIAEGTWNEDAIAFGREMIALGRAERVPMTDAEAVSLLKFGDDSVPMVRKVERWHGIGAAQREGTSDDHG